MEAFGDALTGPTDEAVELALEAWGAEGWEVVSPVQRESSLRITGIAYQPTGSAGRRSLVA